MQKTNRLRLILEVEYDLEDETIQTMTEHLQARLNHAIGNGMLSGDTSATVENYTASITAIPTTTETIQPRIAACLDACEGVQTEVLQEMGTGTMSRLRDRSHLDRLLFRDAREMVAALTNKATAAIDGRDDDEPECLKLLAALKAAHHFLTATQEDDVGRPAGQLVGFIEQVAAFKKWGDGSNEMGDDPSDGTDDSHACLMDLIDQARDILKP